MSGGDASDTFAGGVGTDTASYADHTLAVSASLDGVANDGAVGELDNVATDVENLVGGSGADVLTGSSSANTFDGGLGADTVSGLTGTDTITYASRTASVVVKLDANANDGQVGELDKILTDVENVIGGAGKDTITGSKFANSITGGLGADKLIGGSGNDSFYAKDGVKDTIDGGSGTDGAQADKSDVRTSIEKTIR
jgi:Ca2+-binding RTX toxin-like protein